jgi:subtilisin family serine protease
MRSDWAVERTLKAPGVLFQSEVGGFAPVGTPASSKLRDKVSAMDALDLVRLRPLMQQTSGRPTITLGLIDGPVSTQLPDFTKENIRDIPGKSGGTCVRPDSVACAHGTFVAGILVAKRGSEAPAICPDCTLLVRPIFTEATPGNGQMPSATPEELAKAVLETIDAGAHIINMSVGLLQSTVKGERALRDSLDYAAGRGVITVVAGGNQGNIGGSVITGHPWVIPVVAFDLEGRPTGYTNLGNSLGRRGLGGPGQGITSLGADGKPRSFGGTSAAAPFVTGTIALLWSEFPTASAGQIKLAVTRGYAPRRAAIAPPLLDAWAAYESMTLNQAQG